MISVFGDIILDRYIYCEAVKLNPESTGLVYLDTADEWRLGGAGAVAGLIADVGDSVWLSGPVNTEQALRINNLCKARNISPRLNHERDYVTPLKTRCIYKGELLPDRHDIELTSQAWREAFLCSAVDVLVIADYGKGSCARISEWLPRLHSRRIIVDPAPVADWNIYRGAWLLKANYVECRNAAERLGFRHTAPFTLAAILSQALDMHVVLTKDADGMYVQEHGQEQVGAFYHIPAVSTSVLDVCGAGDTVTAGIAVGMQRGMTLSESCELAAELAAQQVSQIGVGRIKYPVLQ